MRKPSLGVDAILAALAVLSTGAVGCSKAERSSADPAAASPQGATPKAEQAPAPAPPPPPAFAEPSPQPSTPLATASPAPPGAIDAGKEKKPAPIGRGVKGQAACGANGCTDEMKKGGK